jgi:hypothetical protein
VNADGLDPVPPGVVTDTGPDVAPTGTVAVIDVPDTTENDADTPLNFTADAPDKFDPLTDTDDPTTPLAGDNPDTTGAGGGPPPPPVSEPTVYWRRIHLSYSVVVHAGGVPQIKSKPAYAVKAARFAVRSGSKTFCGRADEL